MDKIKLSVSKTTVKKKSDGIYVTDFDVKEIPIEQKALEELFSSRVYSANIWKDGKPSNDGFLELSAIVLDSDDGKLTLAQAKEKFKLYHYILHTSTRHQVDVPDHNGIQDRFRMLFPVDAATIEKIKTGELAGSVYDYILEIQSFADKSCADPARKYFPFCGEDPTKFEVYINEGFPYKIDFEKVKETITSQSKRKAELVNSVPDTAQRIRLDDEVILRDRKTKVRIGDITEKTACYCLFCDDLNTESASAFIQPNPKHKVFLVCSHCKKTYYLYAQEHYPELFQIEDKLFLVRQLPRNVHIVKTTEAYYNNLSIEDAKQFKFWLAHSTAASDSFRVERYTDPDIDTAKYKLDRESGLLEIRLPPIPVKDKDNDRVNEWFARYGDRHAQFLKMFAMQYCYINYKRAPTLIMTGKRGGGKTTFVEILGGIFENMFKPWEQSESAFNEHLEAKIVSIDEALIDKAEQYATLKLLTGNEKITINKKYGAKYVIRNNLMIVIMTNKSIPLYLEESEVPADETKNQFYLMKVPPLQKVNSDAKAQILDAMGWYVQTEMRELYESWMKNPEQGSYRYTIPVPITNSLRKLYSHSRSPITDEAGMIYEALTKGIVIKDPKTQTPIGTFGPYEYADTNIIKEAIRYTGANALPPSKWNNYIKEMQRLGYLSFIHIDKKGWKVELNPIEFADEDDFDDEE